MEQIRKGSIGTGIEREVPRQISAADTRNMVAAKGASVGQVKHDAVSNQVNPVNQTAQKSAEPEQRGPASNVAGALSVGKRAVDSPSATLIDKKRYDELVSRTRGTEAAQEAGECRFRRRDVSTRFHPRADRAILSLFHLHDSSQT